MNVYITKKNPILDFIQIRPNDIVVIKPNLVKESKDTDKQEWKSVITSSYVIGVVAEYVCQRLKDTGRLYICDAPQTDSSFKAIVEKLRLNEIATDCTNKYGTEVNIVDLRNEEWTNEKGVIVKREKLAGDPKGTIAFNLGKDSLFYGHKGEGKYYGADYDFREVNKHHSQETQEYLICGTPIHADVFISLPKLKTHKKTGVTLSIKNLVGINADKNWLPHHTWGSPKTGGDEYPDVSLKRKVETWGSQAVKKFVIRYPSLGMKITQIARKEGAKIFGSGTDTIRSGNWYGNDTTWRMTLDLSRCLLYGNMNGTLHPDRKKRCYSVIDGEIGMEGAGPMQGEPKECGVFISGEDLASVDAVAATLMGFDWKRLPVIREAFAQVALPISNVNPDDIKIVSNVDEWNCNLDEFRMKNHFDFRPHFGWKNYMELPNHKLL